MTFNNLYYSRRYMNIPEDKIKLENIEMQGKLDIFTFLNKEYRLKSLPGWFVFEG